MIKLIAALALSTTTVTAEPVESTCLRPEEALALFQAMMPAAIEGMASKCSNVLPSDAFLRTGAGELAARIRRDSRFEPGLLMTAFAKAGGSGSLGAGSGERELVPWSGPEQCSRLAWFRTLSLHAPPLCDGYPSIWNYSPVGPAT